MLELCLCDKLVFPIQYVNLKESSDLYLKFWIKLWIYKVELLRLKIFVSNLTVRVLLILIFQHKEISNTQSLFSRIDKLEFNTSEDDRKSRLFEATITRPTYTFLAII